MISLSDVPAEYVRQTGRPLPINAAVLNRLFAAIVDGQALPNRGQQATDLGLTAHALTDSHVDPNLYHYYTWVLTHAFAGRPINEVTAKLIGMAFTSANVFQTDLPQPLTINPWQEEAMATFPLAHMRVVVLENNGVFALLHQMHPQWPLILQSGNDFNSTYVALIQQLASRGLHYAYLGDIDSKGIQMADHFCGLLDQPDTDIMALQPLADVNYWLGAYGQQDVKRTKRRQVQDPVLQAQMDAVVVTQRFVEQEQLVEEYELRIGRWLQG